MKYFKDTSGGVHGFDESDPAQVVLMNELTAGWTDITGSWPLAPAPIPLSQQAQTQLDIVTGPRGQIIRCVAAGIGVPAAWTQYVQALRAIVNGSDKTSTALPTQPPYVAGT